MLYGKKKKTLKCGNVWETVFDLCELWLFHFMVGFDNLEFFLKQNIVFYLQVKQNIIGKPKFRWPSIIGLPFNLKKKKLL